MISSAVAAAEDVSVNGGVAYKNINSDVFGGDAKRQKTCFHQPVKQKTAVNGSMSGCLSSPPRHLNGATATAKATAKPTPDSPRLSKQECGLDSKPLQISFHVQFELPLLRKWFTTTPSPSEAQFEAFADELNRTEWRQSTERISVTNDKLRNWWKNERARRRRHQCQGRRAETNGSEKVLSNGVGGAEEMRKEAEEESEGDKESKSAVLANL